MSKRERKLVNRGCETRGERIEVMRMKRHGWRKSRRNKMDIVRSNHKWQAQPRQGSFVKTEAKQRKVYKNYIRTQCE